MLAVAEIMLGFDNWGPESRKFILNLKDETWCNYYVVAEKAVEKRYWLDHKRRAR